MKLSCSICTELYDGTQHFSAVPCGHTFHYACLDPWLRQSLTCPQCRVRIERRKIIERLFFTQEDSEDRLAQDPSRLQNKLDSLQVELKQKTTEMNALLTEQAALNDKLAELRTNYKSMEDTYKKERSQSSSLRKELVQCQEQQREARAAQDESRRLRKLLKDLQNVQEVVTGNVTEAERMVSEQKDIKQMAQWCVTIKKELSRKRDECRTYSTESARYKKELESKQLAVKQLSNEIESVKEQSRLFEEALATAEEEIAYLKENSSGKHSTPRSQCKVLKRSHVGEDSQDSGEDQAKKRRFSGEEVSFLNISSDNSRPKNAARQTSPSSPELPPVLSHFNLFKKRGSYGLQDQPSIIKQGYNGLGGHERFLQPRDKATSVFKKGQSKSSSAIGSTKKPPLPTLGKFKL